MFAALLIDFACYHTCNDDGGYRYLTPPCDESVTNTEVECFKYTTVAISTYKRNPTQMVIAVHRYTCSRNIVVTPLSSVYRIMLVICDAFAGPDLAIKHILSYLILYFLKTSNYMYSRTRRLTNCLSF